MIDILRPVAESKLGFSFGKPERVDEKSLAVVLPILRDTSLNRHYITFPETDQVDVFDTGRIDQMEANNRTEQNVFIRSGTLFKGSTQERALMRSAVIFSGKKQTLGVRCVHATRGIRGSAKVSYGGITPLDFDKGNYTAGYAPADQSTYWSNVQKSTSAMNAKMGKKPTILRASAPRARFSGITRESIHYSGATSSDAFGSGCAAAGPIMAGANASSAFEKSDDLHSTFKEFSMHFDDILSKIKCADNQVGLALIGIAGVETIEFFDHKLSWKALHESAVKRLGSHIVGGDAGVFEYKPERAVQQVVNVLAKDWQTNKIFEHRPANGEPYVLITGLTADGYVGEAVEIGESLAHLVILKQE